MGKDRDLERTLKEVLKEIPQDYRDKSFSHIAIVANALKRDRPEHVLKRLDEYYTNLNETVTDIVDVNFQSFNQSIKNFSDILSNLNESQKKIESLEKDIESCKDLLTSRANDLKQLYENYLQHTEFLNILKQVEEVKSVPEQLQMAIDTKHYLHAVTLILKYSKVLQKPQLKSIKALNPIRANLADIQSNLPDILVDELNRHVYNGVDVSKSTINDILSVFSKKAPPTSAHTTSNSDNNNSSDKKNDKNASPDNQSGDSTPARASARMSRRQQKNSNSTAAPNNTTSGDTKNQEDETLLYDDLTIDPEFDSHYFVMMIIETLDKLDKLGEVQARLIQGLRYELRSLIESHIVDFANNLENNQLRSTDAQSSNSGDTQGSFTLASVFDSDRNSAISAETKSNILWKIIQNKKLSLIPNSSMDSSENNVVKKAILQGTLLSECLGSLFSKLRGVLWNYKFVVDVMDLKFKTGKKETTLASRFAEEEEHDGGLNIKLTSTVLSRVRDTVRLKLEDLRNDPRADPLYSAALEDLLYNFIEKQQGLNTSGNQKLNAMNNPSPAPQHDFKLKQIPEMFKEMVATQVKLKASADPAAEIRMSMITQDFMDLIVNGFTSPDIPRLLTGEHVWKTIQNELKTVLKDILGVTAEEMSTYSSGFAQETLPSVTSALTAAPVTTSTPTPSEKKKKKKTKVQEYKLRFRFGTNIENVSQPEIPVAVANDKVAAAPDQKAGFSAMTTPLLNYFFFTPYNMIWMYRLVREFNEDCQQIVGSTNLQSPEAKSSPKGFDAFMDTNTSTSELETDLNSDYQLDVLQDFMTDVIQHSLISLVRKDYRVKITELLKENEAFRPREYLYTKTNPVYSSDEKFRPLLSSTVSLSQWIDELFQFANAIPPNRAEFFSIMEMLLKRYLEDCKLKFREKITGKYVWDCLLNRTDLIPILELDRVWQSLYLTNSQSVNSEEEKNNPFPKLVTTTDLKSLYQKKNMEDVQVDLFAVDHNLVQFTNKERTLIMDRASSIILLCNLSDSLEWLAEQIARISKSGFNSVMDVMLPQSEQLFSSLIGNMNATVGGAEFSTATMQSSETMSRTLKDYYRKYKLLANQCLFALKIDIRAHCYFYLSDIQDSIYESEEEASEPENFVTQFNTDLQQLQRHIVTYLPLNKKSYLFHGVAPLVARILITSLPKIKHQKFNRNGVAKMRRNIFALQQNITSIVHNSSSAIATTTGKNIQYSRSTDDHRLLLASSSSSFLPSQNQIQLLSHNPNLEKDVYFNRVRLYYSLLTLSIKELFAHLRSDDVLLYLYNEYGEMYADVDVFSLDEYMVILETKFTNNESDEDKQKNRNILRSLYEQMQQEISELAENDDVNVM